MTDTVAPPGPYQASTCAGSVHLGGRRGMGYMLKCLTDHPERGFLGYKNAGLTVIQYWRSFEHLEAFAKNTDDPHLEPWRTYWRRVGKSTRAEIWHENYLVRSGEYEAIYGNMPPHGLGKATNLVPVAESVSARQRIATTWITHPFAVWEDAAADTGNIEWAKSFRRDIAHYATGGVYLNFIGDEGEDRVRAAYGEAKYTRLAGIKAEWDPTNVFRGNQNIKPA